MSTITRKHVNVLAPQTTRAMIGIPISGYRTTTLLTNKIFHLLLKTLRHLRRGAELNRRIVLLQRTALPLGYRAMLFCCPHSPLDNALHYPTSLSADRTTRLYILITLAQTRSYYIAVFLFYHLKISDGTFFILIFLSNVNCNAGAIFLSPRNTSFFLPSGNTEMATAAVSSS